MVPEWQQQVIDEAADLEARLAKFRDYLYKPVEIVAFSAEAENRRLMVIQAEQMSAYLVTLGARMDLFLDLL